MSSVAIGTRVLAIQSAEGDKAEVYGEGVFAGNFRPPNGTQTPFGPVDDSFSDSFTNPRIDLDSGGVVWGCQCWWGPVEAAERFLNGCTVVLVSPPELVVTTAPVEITQDLVPSERGVGLTDISERLGRGDVGAS